MPLYLAGHKFGWPESMNFLKDRNFGKKSKILPWHFKKFFQTKVYEDLKRNHLFDWRVKLPILARFTNLCGYHDFRNAVATVSSGISKIPTVNFEIHSLSFYLFKSFDFPVTEIHAPGNWIQGTNWKTFRLNWIKGYPGLAEAVRRLGPWSDQKFCHLWSKSYIFKILVGPIIVWSKFFSNGRTNVPLLPPSLLPYACFWCTPMSAEW